MAKNKSNLSMAIIFAAVMISGSLIYFASQITAPAPNDLSAQIQEGIEAYVNGTQGADRAVAEINMDDLVENQPYMGEEDASVVLVEFSDYKCGYCSKFFNETLPLIKEKYVDTGKLKFVYKDFLLGYKGDYEAALAAECTRDQLGNEAFFDMHSHIFETISDGFSIDTYADYAAILGADRSEFVTCVESEKFKEEIYGDGEMGRSVGVSGTPGFVLNGKVISGAQPYRVFEEAIESELQK